MHLVQVISVVEGVSGGVADIMSSVCKAALTAHVCVCTCLQKRSSACVCVDSCGHPAYLSIELLLLSTRCEHTNQCLSVSCAAVPACLHSVRGGEEQL